MKNNILLNRLVLTSLIIISALFCYAQEHRSCGTEHYIQTTLNDPAYLKKQEIIQERFEEQLERIRSIERLNTSPFLIPVAVHFPEANESDRTCLVEMTQNQIDVLNASFTGTNADISNWISDSQFYPGINTGSMDVIFCLATFNHPPNTDPELVEDAPAVTIGYDFGSGQNSDSNWAGYLNVVVKRLPAIANGASPVGGSISNGDAILINLDAFGSGAGCPDSEIIPGSSLILGRSLVHEVGHFFNLKHTFTSSCDTDDGIDDTPNISSPNYDCPNPGSIDACVNDDCPGPGPCPNEGKALTMSYMEYVDDPCRYMFTEGQVTVMTAYLLAIEPDFKSNVMYCCRDSEVFEFHFENANGDITNEFCLTEDVFIDGSQISNIRSYRLELEILHPDGTTNLLGALDLAGTPTLINVTDLFENHPIPPVTFVPGTYRLKLISSHPDCGLVEEIKEFTIFAKPTSVFHFENDQQQQRTSFCISEQVFLDGSQSEGEVRYRLRVHRAPVGSNNFTDVATKWHWGKINIINFSQWLIDRGFPMEEGFMYRVGLRTRDRCDKWTDSTKTFEVTPNEVTAAFHFEDAQQNVREEFCSSDQVFLNGSASVGEMKSFFEVGRRPIDGGPFQPLFFGPVPGKINTINFGQWMTSNGFSLEAGYVYSVKLGVQNECDPWDEVIHSFRMVQCCDAPTNLACTSFNGITSLIWSSDASSNFWLFIDPTVSCCGNQDLLIPAPIVVNTNSFNRANIPYRCFEWWVQAICDDENSPASERRCWDEETACIGFGFTPSIGDNPKKATPSWSPKISPNPSNGRLLIEFNISQPTDIQIEIFDTSGKKVMNFHQKETSIGLFKHEWFADSNLANGLYIINIKTSNDTHHEKVIINR